MAVKPPSPREEVYVLWPLCPREGLCLALPCADYCGEHPSETGRSRYELDPVLFSMKDRTHGDIFDSSFHADRWSLVTLIFHILLEEKHQIFIAL